MTNTNHTNLDLGDKIFGFLFFWFMGMSATVILGVGMGLLPPEAPTVSAFLAVVLGWPLYLAKFILIGIGWIGIAGWELLTYGF